MHKLEINKAKNHLNSNFRKYLKYLFVFCIGIVVFSLVNAFTIQTSLLNIVQYIKQVVVTSDGGNSGEVYVNLNRNGTGEVYIKNNLNIGGTGKLDKLYVKGKSFFDGNILQEGVLTINQSVNTGNIVIFHKNNDSSNIGDSFGKILFYNGDTNTDTQRQSASIQSINIDSLGRHTRLGIYTANGVSGESEKMSITNTGNVGIGVTNPSQKLEVFGAIKIGNTNINTGAGTIKFSGSNFYGHNGTTWLQLHN